VARASRSTRTARRFEGRLPSLDSAAAFDPARRPETCRAAEWPSACRCSVAARTPVAASSTVDNIRYSSYVSRRWLTPVQMGAAAMATRPRSAAPGTGRADRAPARLGHDVEGREVCTTP